MMMMSSSKIKNRVGRHIIQPRYIFSSRLWWVTLMHHHKPPKALNLVFGGRSSKKDPTTSLSLEYYSGKEALIAGEPQNTEMRVPKGSLAVYVGPEERRFVIPACYLSMPDFKGLMEKAAEEFGYEHEGGLRIPCEEDDFEDILKRCLAMHQAMSKAKGKSKSKGKPKIQY
ncbi:hypothetical protein U1Q18_006222 [Sarracenia purpurea var. burkii]